MNICMVGCGMMGGWHSEALKGWDCNLHTLVGQAPEPTADFAAAQGYARWTTDFAEALATPDIDVVVVATPSALHAEMAVAALDAGKHVLVEIPIAMSLADAERVVATADRRGLQLGVVHPMRFRAEHRALVARAAAGEEAIRHVQARLFLHRLENVGSTGSKRDWTDDILWHHGAHLVDVCLWLAGAGDPGAAADRLRNLGSAMPRRHARTGIPMELAILAETGPEQAFACTGSYHSTTRLFDVFAVTDKDAYQLDILKGTMTVAGREAVVASEKENAAQVVRDFVEAVRQGRAPLVTGRSVLPAMAILQRIQDRWQERWAAEGAEAPAVGGKP